MKNTWIKVAAVIFFLASFGLILGRNLPRILSASAPDFTQVWKSAKALTVRGEPYLDANLDYPNAYPPVSEIFFVPLALLSYHQALSIFTFISVASIVGSVYLSIRLVGKKVPWHYFLLFLGASFFTFPVKFSLGMGQINMIVLFLLLLAYYLERGSKGSCFWAGISLGAAIALKPIFAFFLLFLALKKSWKVIGVSILTVAVLVIASLIFWSPKIWLTWYQTGIAPLTNYTSPMIYVYSNQGIFGFLTKFFKNINFAVFVSRTATIILIPLAIYVVYKKREFNLGLSFFIITLLLFDITSWQHHFVWLMFPFIILLYNTIEAKNSVFLVLLILSYFLVSSKFVQPTLHPIILWPTQFYAAVILWGINLYFLMSGSAQRSRLPDINPVNKFFEALKFE